jgi:hypothetical protein
MRGGVTGFGAAWRWCEPSFALCERHRHHIGSRRGGPMATFMAKRETRRSLAVSCILCHHAARLDVDGYADHATVPSFGPRMVCTSGGIIGPDARPNWREEAERPTLTGMQWRN